MDIVMRNFTQLKFGDYTFMHNPEKLTVSNRLSGSTAVMPYCGSRYETVALENARFKGKGVITGENCFEKLLLLLEALKSGKSRLLSISPFPSVKAVLTALEYTLTPKENTIDIDFEFTASSSAARLESEIPHTVAADNGESLWDISYKYGIPVESLLQLNPAVKRPDILENGQVITLW